MALRSPAVVAVAFSAIVCCAGPVVALDPPPAEPPTPGSMLDLPGARTCVSCNFFLGLGVLALEVALIWSLTSAIAAQQVVSKSQRRAAARRDDVAAAASTPALAVVHTVLDSVGWLLALAGLLYWGLTFATYWNFISYLLTVGPVAVTPAIVWSYTHTPASSVRTQLAWRRVKLAGWLLGVLMLAAFTNVSVFPDQLYRHLHKSESTIVPNDPMVLAMRDTFYEDNPKAIFDSLPFNQRMSIVDEFVKAKRPGLTVAPATQVTWKSDYSQYQVLGLLTSPHDVLSRGAGDCQGQSSVTASLLFALGGVQAFCVETPFHWWTHAMDKKTGETYNLNSHGSAGLQGSVLPQPPDMIYTWYPPSCTVGVDNCTTVDAHNRNTMHWVSPPWRAFMTAYTGMHEFRRDIMPHFAGSNQWQLVAIGVVIAVVIAVYASYFQVDLAGSFASPAGYLRIAKRLGAALPASVFCMYFTYVWAYVYFPVVMIHLVGMVCFGITFVCNDGYNRSIGTPTPVPSPYSVTSLLRRCGCVRDAEDGDYDDDDSAAQEWGAVALSPRSGASRGSSPVVYARRLSDPTSRPEQQPLIAPSLAGAVNSSGTSGAPYRGAATGYAALSPRATGAPSVVGFVSMA